MTTRPPAGQGWSRCRVVALVVALTLVVAALAASTLFYRASEINPGRNGYNLATWEARHFPVKWLFQLEQLFSGKPDTVEQDAVLRRFFELVRSIDDLDRQVQRNPDAGPEVVEALAAQLEERDRLQHQVQATIQGRITAVAEAEGLTRSFLSIVWPPVNFELATSPKILVTSPRERIQLRGTRILQPGLNRTEVEAIEDATERKQGVSAQAFPTGGIGAYPAIVEYTGSYESLLDVVAHEWTHNYLFFRPLGLNYYRNGDLRTINETVADLVGQELAQAVLARWPLDAAAPLEKPASPATQPPAETQPRERLDARAVLRQLRSDVDALLAQGKIDEAEALMDRKRQELADQGFVIRKINQAYFAFVNLYAGEAGQPGATNPIGPKVDELRRKAGLLRRFAELVGDVTSVQDLDEALSKLP